MPDESPPLVQGDCCGKPEEKLEIKRRDFLQAFTAAAAAFCVSGSQDGILPIFRTHKQRLGNIQTEAARALQGQTDLSPEFRWLTDLETEFYTFIDRYRDPFDPRDRTKARKTMEASELIQWLGCYLNNVLSPDSKGIADIPAVAAGDFALRPKGEKTFVPSFPAALPAFSKGKELTTPLYSSRCGGISAAASLILARSAHQAPAQYKNAAEEITKVEIWLLRLSPSGLISHPAAFLHYQPVIHTSNGYYYVLQEDSGGRFVQVPANKPIKQALYEVSDYPNAEMCFSCSRTEHPV